MVSIKKVIGAEHLPHFTLRKTEQPLRVMELQKRSIKRLKLAGSCLERTYR